MFNSTLTSIDKFTRKQASRNFFLRMTFAKGDIGRIQEYRERLRQSLDVFWVRISLPKNQMHLVMFSWSCNLASASVIICHKSLSSKARCIRLWKIADLMTVDLRLKVGLKSSRRPNTTTRSSTMQEEGIHFRLQATRSLTPALTIPLR